MGRGIKRIVPEGTKWCPGCKATVDVSLFAFSNKERGILSSYCKTHDATRRRKHYITNTDKAIDRQYKYNYGIDGDVYIELFLKQQGKCAVCGRAEDRMHYSKVMRLAVDHCHKTGKIRGLLCRECNLALGHLEDNAERIRALLKYVEQEGEL